VTEAELKAIEERWSKATPGPLMSHAPADVQVLLAAVRQLQENVRNMATMSDAHVKMIYEYKERRDAELAAANARAYDWYLRYESLFAAGDDMTEDADNEIEILQDDLYAANKRAELAEGQKKYAYKLCDEMLALNEGTLKKAEEIEASLNETYTDENGTVWTRPTAWAYAAACKANDKNREANERAKSRVAKMRDALEKTKMLPAAQYLCKECSRRFIWHAALHCPYCAGELIDISYKGMPGWVSGGSGPIATGGIVDIQKAVIEGEK